LQGNVEKGPCSPSPNTFTETNDKDFTLTVTPDNKLRISSVQIKKKKQHKKRNQNFDGHLEEFLRKRTDEVALKHPELSTKQVEKYLTKEWNDLNKLQQSK
jgi:hypothetical protein